MPRFVILRHECAAGSPRPSHWDLMLENGDSLRTWSLFLSPDEPTQVVEELPAHRLAYLDYEGPISGGRGAVVRWDAGEFQIERQQDREVVARLEGSRLRGRMTLERLAEEPQRWRLTWAPERSAVFNLPDEAEGA